MATTKGTKKGRGAVTTRTKATARGRSTSPKKATARSKAPTAAKPKAVSKTKPVAKPKAAAKPVAKAAPAAAKRPAAKPAAGAESAEVTALKNKFQRERNGLEKRLTEAVREIGLLRHHELRAMQLERQVAERDATIERLQAQLAEVQRRPSEPVYVHEVQQSLALGVVTSDDEADSGALDEFEEEALVDDGDLISDD